MTVRRLLLVLLLPISMTGCITPYVTDLDDNGLNGQLQTIPHVRVEYIEQQQAATCGLATLQSVAAYWGVPLDQAQLYIARPPLDVERGYSLGELQSIASEAGLTSFVLQGDPAFLEAMIQKGRPVIAALKVKPRPLVELPAELSQRLLNTFSPSYNHFVVVFGYGNDKVVVMDPVQGYYSLKVDEFAKMWQAMGNAALLVAR